MYSQLGQGSGWHIRDRGDQSPLYQTEIESDFQTLNIQKPNMGVREGIDRSSGKWK